MENITAVPFFDFCFDFPSFPLTSCSRFSSSAFFFAVSAAGLLDFCTADKNKNNTMIILMYMYSNYTICYTCLIVISCLC